MGTPSPETLHVIRLLGHLMVNHGHAAQGMVLLQATDALQPGDRWTRRALARACMAAGQPAAGLKVVHLMRDDGDAPALAWLLEGQAMVGLGRRNDAFRAYREFLRLRAARANGHAT